MAAPSPLAALSWVGLCLRHVAEGREAFAAQGSALRYLQLQGFGPLALSLLPALQARAPEELERAMALCDAVVGLPFARCGAGGGLREALPALSLAELGSGAWGPRGEELLPAVRELLPLAALAARLLGAMAGAALSAEGGLRPGGLRVLASGLTALRGVARADFRALQAGLLGEEGSSAEYHHLSGALLDAFSAGEVAGPEAEHCVGELLVVVGYACLDCPPARERVRWGATGEGGGRRSLLRRLLGLPFDYFSEPRRMRLLFPSVMLAAMGDAENRRIVEDEIDETLFGRWLRRESARCEESVTLSWRMPEELWRGAIAAFGGQAG